MDKKRIAVIIPLYNPPALWEGNCIEHIIAIIELYSQYSFYFVFVNDSPKNILNKKIVTLLTTFKIEYKILTLKKHLGKGMALKVGVREVRADYYLCIDWDFPFGIIVLQDIISKLEKGANVVTINRGKKYLTQLPLLRSSLTMIWRLFINRIVKLDINDTQSGLKGFDNVGKKLFLQAFTNSFLHDLEFIYLCRENNLSLAVVEASARPGLQFTNFSLKVYLNELRSLYHLFYYYSLKRKTRLKREIA